jgi:hypothetical protein
MKLKEGETYKFKIRGKKKFPDGEYCYIMQDPFGYQHYLPATYYEKYNIDSLEYLECKVDKINCSGKIFLEPPHPDYVVGESYDFECIDIKKEDDGMGGSMYIAIVKDCLGKESDLRISAAFAAIHQPPFSIHCRVERIKKGKAFLSHPESGKLGFHLKEGRNYKFLVKKIIKLSDNKEYFIMLDEYDESHLLPVKNYKHYNLFAGQKVQCNVIKVTSTGDYQIEPLNPWYQLNECYYFDVKDVTGDDISILAKDGFTYRLNRKGRYIREDEKKILLKITKFKKGRLLLDWPDNNDYE